MKANPKTITDEDLLEGCLRRDSKMQKQFYERFAPKMMAVCRRYAQDEDEAKDMLQEGFIRVFEKLVQFKRAGSLEGWVRMVVINNALIMIRRSRHYRNQPGLDEVEEVGSQHIDVLQKMSADELMKLVLNMPQGYRTVFNLFAIEGFSHREISEKLEISESTSKTQFHKARAHLRKALSELEKTTL